jgi:tripartite-type tricarboxylate transporter receptor subunit TctC
MKLARRQFLYLATGASALSAVSRIARAQATYPTRPVRIIVPYAPGGGTDFAARVIGEYLSRGIGQQVIIENKSGGSSMIGTETAAKAPPDGYTVLVTTDSIASVPHIVNFNTDYVKDLVPVILLARNPIILAVHPALGVNSVAELIRVAKMRPGMGYATAGVGSQQHFVAEWFAQIAGLKLDHVPYRGAGQAVNDLVAGHVRIAFLGPPALIPQYKAGNVLLLAQSSAMRSPSLPEVPTFAEAGVEGLRVDLWNGAFVPAGTPPAVITRLNTEMGKALADGATRDKLMEATLEPLGGTPKQFADLVQQDSEKYARLAKQLNIKAE